MSDQLYKAEICVRWWHNDERGDVGGSGVLTKVPATTLQGLISGFIHILQTHKTIYF